MTNKTLFERAVRVIPGGVNSPVRSFSHVGTQPIFFNRGEGAYLFDVEGKKYVDFCGSFGPHLLGHSNPRVVAAVKEQSERAFSFGACHPGEVELAERILTGYSFLDKVRLVSSGTEAVMTAIRLARAATGRSKVIKFDGCYHGHSDGLLASSGSGVASLTQSSSEGVPVSIVQETLIARFDELSTLNAIFRRFPNDVAALILEPIPANYGLYVPDREQLCRCMELCRTHGALVIFDEVITGFRLGISGASGHYDLRPDLVTLGKVIGGGLPLAAVVGKDSIMNRLAPSGQVYQAGTLSGNPMATGAGCATLIEISVGGFFEELAQRTHSFAIRLREVLLRWHPRAGILQMGSLFWPHFGADTNSFPPQIPQESHTSYARFFRSALEQGIYFPPSPYEVSFVSAAHSDAVLSEVVDRLEKCS